MNWQLATFTGLALVLAGGFWWYERSRPPARLVALVAALAALAVAGRLVLAPVPNLVATTDIALITGYALGAGPGFAVGALAAPISNIWLGQGPWTAWQMAGWGLVGLAGAWLAIVTGRRLGRFGLAATCAIAGLAYGALLDFSVMVTYGGEQSLDRYLALSGRGIPFNLAHAVGNFAIALAAGPALVRMISRFRTRLEFTWRPAGALPLVVLVLLAAASFAAAPPPATAKQTGASTAARVGYASQTGASTAARVGYASQTGVGWLVDTQNSDGGFAATSGQPSSPAMTGWAMLALEASGRNPLDLRSGGETPVTYLRSQAGRLRAVGDLERTILALTGAGLDPREFAGINLVSELRSRRDGDGSVDGQVNLTAFYALAIRASGADPGSLKRSARWLRRAQNADGGWGIQPAAPSESDSTGAALQGLVAAGSQGSATADGAAWLRKAQRGGGGYALGSSGVVNSQSTAWAVQGLAAAGGGGDAIDRGLAYLNRLQSADGHYRYSASSDQTPIWVTMQAVLAIERQPFPIPAVARTSGPSGSAAETGSSDGSPATSSSGGAATGSAGGPATSAGAPATSDGGSGGGIAAGDGNSGGGAAAGGAEAGAGVQAAARGAGQTAGIDPGGDELAPAAGDEVTTPVSVSYAPESSGDDHTTAYLLGGLAVLAAIVAGGYLLYRRLP